MTDHELQLEAVTLRRATHQLLLIWLVCGMALCSVAGLAGEVVSRPRVVVSTDIGGTDPDDFQSMVHLLLYADTLEIEGLVSSPYGPGRKDHILQVIDSYERDYPKLKTYSATYPTAETLRTVTKQGETDEAPYAGVRRATEGSEWIIQCARRADPRPLQVLVWGGIEDLAQALYDAPDILPQLRVYYIGGPNKKWGPDAYQYILTHHPRLWIIEANATYRGWFTRGNQAGEWSNREFVAQHVAGRGALGEFFNRQLEGVIKMGDTPSVGWLLHGTPLDPTQPGWGGQFVRAWKRPYVRYDRLTTAADRIEQFGVLELALPIGESGATNAAAWMEIENQSRPGHFADGSVRFRFSPKDAKEYRYTIRSTVPDLHGKEGVITAFPPPPDAVQRPDPRLPNWWTDDPSPAKAEGRHIGTKTVSRWREDFLRDFAERLERCRIAKP